MVYLARTFPADPLRGQHRFAEVLLLASYTRFEHPNAVTVGWRRDALNGFGELYDTEGQAGRGSQAPCAARRFRTLGLRDQAFIAATSVTVTPRSGW